MAKQLNVNLSFTADTSRAQQQIQALNRTLQEVQNFKTININDAGIQAAKQAALDLQHHLNAAVDVNTGKLDLSKFSQSLIKSNQSLSSLYTDLVKVGPQGQQAFLQLAQSINSANQSTLTLSSRLGTLWTTLKNVARFQISSSIMHGVVGAIQSAYGYAQDLNESLNNIRIVTGQNTDQMARFAKEANNAARALSATTLDYTKASLIYYQQGLSDQEVKERTDVTIKMANVSRQSAESVSDQMTAIWNNFDNGSESLEYYADVITALGAATASSSQEIAGGLEKFAAVADTVGLSYEYAASALATIVATTRQSEETVGTGLRTLFSRLQGLKLGDTLEDGVDLNKYSAALASVGVQALDATGELRRMDEILDDLGARWGMLSKAQQVALAQTVGGVRQYTNLIALMDNWDFMQRNVQIADTSEGTLQKQADIYSESWEAARDRVQAALEQIYDQLLNDKAFIGMLNGIEKLIDFVSNLIDGFGGLKGIVLSLGSIFLNQYAKEIPNILARVGDNLRVITGQAEKNRVEMIASVNKQVQQMAPNINDGAEISTQIAGTKKITAAQLDLAQNYSRLSEVERQVAQQKIAEAQARLQNVAAIGAEIDALNKKAMAFKSNLQTSSEGGIRQWRSTRQPTWEESNEDRKSQEQMKKDQIRLQQLQAERNTYTETYKAQGATEAQIRFWNRTRDARINELGANIGRAETEHRNFMGSTRSSEAIYNSYMEQNKRLGQYDKISNYVATNSKQLQESAQAGTTDTKAFEAVKKSLQGLLNAAKDAKLEVSALQDQLDKATPGNMPKVAEEITNTLDAGGDTIVNATAKAEEQINVDQANLENRGIWNKDTEKGFKDLAQNMHVVGGESINLKAGLDGVGQGLDQLGQHTAQTSELFGSLAAGAMAAANAVSAFQRLGSIWDNDSLTDGEKLTQSITAVSSALMGLIPLLNIKRMAELSAAAATLLGMKAQAAKIPVDIAAGTAGWYSLGPLLLFVVIAGAAIAAIVGIALALKAITDNANASGIHLQHLTDAVSELGDKAKETTQEAEGLRSAFDNYNSIIETLAQCTAGTQAWRDAMKELSDLVVGLATEYPDVFEKLDIEYGKDGSIKINNFEEIVNSKERQALEQQYGAALGRLLVSSESLIKQEADLNSSFWDSVYKTSVYRTRDAGYNMFAADNGGVSGAALQTFLDTFVNQPTVKTNDIYSAFIEQFGASLRENDEFSKSMESDEEFNNMLNDILKESGVVTDLWKPYIEQRKQYIQTQKENAQAFKNAGLLYVNSMLDEFIPVYMRQLLGVDAAQGLQEQYQSIIKESNTYAKGDTTNAWARGLIRDYLAFQGLQEGVDYSLINNAIRGIDANRTLAWKNKQTGEEEEANIATIAYNAALYRLNNRSSNISADSEFLSKRQAQYEQILSGVPDILKTVLGLTAIGESLDSIKLEDIRKLKTNRVLGDKIFELSQDDLLGGTVKSLVNNLRVIDITTNNFTGVLHDFYQTLLDSNTTTLGELNTYQQAFNKLPDEFKDLNLTDGIINDDEFSTFMEEMIAGWQTPDDFVKFKEKYQEKFNKYTDSWIKIEQILDTLYYESMYKLAANVPDYLAKYSKAKNVLDKLKLGDTIKQKDYDAIYNFSSTLAEELFGESGLLDETLYTLQSGISVEDAQQRLDKTLRAGLQARREGLRREQESLQKEGILDEDLNIINQTDFAGDQEKYDDLLKRAVIYKEGILQLQAISNAYASTAKTVTELQTMLSEGFINQDTFDNMAEYIQMQDVVNSGLDIEKWQEYRNSLMETQKQFENNTIAAGEFAKAQMLLEDGVASLSKTYETWNILLNTAGKNTYAVRAALKAVKKDIENILGTETSNEFLEWARQQGVIQVAATGTKEGVSSLQQAWADYSIVGEEILKEDANREALLAKRLREIFNFGEEIDDTAIVTQYQSIMDQIAEIEPGELLPPETRAYLNALAEADLATGKSLEDIQKKYAGFGAGLTPEFEEIPKNEVDADVTYYQPQYDENGLLIAANPISGSNVISETSGKVFKLKGFGDATKLTSAGPASSKGGGGGGGSKKPPKPERYHVIENKLQNNNRRQQAISREKERAAGQARIELLKEENKLREEALKLQNQYEDEIHDWLDKDKQALIDAYKPLGLQIQFDAEGEIANFDELDQAYVDFGDESNETWKEAREALSQYEETLDKLNDKMDEIVQLQDELNDAMLEMTQTKIELQLDVVTDRFEYLDYLLDKIDDDAYQAAEAIAIMGDKTAETMKKVNTYTAGLEEILARHGFSLSDLNNLTLEDLQNANFTQAEIDQIREWRSELLQANQDLLEMRKTIVDKLISAFDDLNEKIQKSYDNFDKYNSVLEHYKNITDLMGSAISGQSRDIMNKLNDAMLRNAENTVRAAKKIYDDAVEANAQAQAAFDAAQASGDYEAMRRWEEVVQTTSERMQEAKEQLLEAWEGSLELIREYFERTMEECAESYGKTMGGLFGSLDYLQEAYDRQKELNKQYLEDWDKLYELSKLSRDISAAIDDTDSIKAKERLRALQAEINKLQMDGTKLSEYDVQVLEKRFELEKARLALDDAQNAKSQVRLQRDSNGNWGYVYTADEDEVAKAEQEYEDKLHEYQQLNAEYLEQLQDEALNVQKTWQETIGQIMHDNATGGIDSAEAQARIEEANRWLAEQQNYFAEQSGHALDNQASLYQRTLDTYGVSTANIVDTWAETNLAMQSQLNNLDAYMQNWNNAAQTYLAGTQAALDEYTAQVNSTNDEAGVITGEFGTHIDNVIVDLNNLSDDTIQNVSELSDAMKNEFANALIEAVLWEQKYVTAMDEMIVRNEQFVKSINLMIEALAGVDTDTVSMLNPLSLVENTVNQSTMDLYKSALDEYISMNKDHILSMIDTNVAAMATGLGGTIGLTTMPTVTDSLEQNVTITASFPNATNHNEIEEAFNNLINKAAQYANRKGL